MRNVLPGVITGIVVLAVPELRNPAISPEQMHHVQPVDYDVWTRIPAPTLSMLTTLHEPWRQIPYSDCTPLLPGSSHPCHTTTRFTREGVTTATLLPQPGSDEAQETMTLLVDAVTRGKYTEYAGVRSVPSSMSSAGAGDAPCYTRFFRFSYTDTRRVMEGSLARIAGLNPQSIVDASTVQWFFIEQDVSGAEHSWTSPHADGAAPRPGWQGRFDEPCCEPIGKQAASDQSPCCGERGMH